MSERWAIALLALASACATDRPAVTVFDASGGEIVVDVLGDGFVRTQGRRIPLEAFVLELRQATRQMPADELAGVVVSVRLSSVASDEAAAQATAADLNRLLDQLYIMDVSQVKVL
jgi:hypothetical protein